MSNTILFFGNERLATGVSTSVPVLQGLLRAGYHVAAIVISQEASGASRSNRQLEIAAVATANNIPLLTPQHLSEASEQLADYQAAAAVLVAYGKLVPQSVIDLFPKGIINIHPSLLPSHRGPTPIESVILKDERETGVSLMRLAAKMDAGPVFAQQSWPLDGSESKQILSERLAALGRDMLLTSLPGILDGSLTARPQDEDRASYDGLIEKQAGRLSNTDWDQPTAQVLRSLRAYAGWPRSRTTIGTTEIIITAAHEGPGSGTPGTLWLEARQLGIHTGDGTLIIDSLIPAGKREMSTQAFLTGYSPN